jgi:hypothetical protein
LGRARTGTCGTPALQSGIAFVLKFQRRGIAAGTHVLEEEAKAWNKCNGSVAPFQASVVHVAGAAAIMMPYMHRVSVAENPAAVVRALERSALSGVCHRDLKPSHVVVFSPVRDRQVGLTDFGRCDIFDPTDAKKRQRAVEDMRRALFPDDQAGSCRTNRVGVSNGVLTLAIAPVPLPTVHPSQPMLALPLQSSLAALRILDIGHGLMENCCCVPRHAARTRRAIAMLLAIAQHKRAVARLFAIAVKKWEWCVRWM